MAAADLLEIVYHRLTGAMFAALPRHEPGPQKLAACRLVAHRGVCDNHRVLENTLPAFEQAAAAGLWGVELDVRFTSDNFPVVIHDPDLQRVFGLPGSVASMTRGRLRELCPGLPDLAEVVDRFGGKIHLMIEIKDDAGSSCLSGGSRLAAILEKLEPAADYHLMSLSPAILAKVAWVPARAKIPIAWAAAGGTSKMALQHGWAGVAGHFLLMTNRRLRLHHRRGQKVGTGFADSPNCLWRELARGVDWVFTNQGDRLQALVNRCIQDER